MYDQLNPQLDTHCQQPDAQTETQLDAQSDAKMTSGSVTKSVEKTAVKTVKLFDATSIKKIESALKNAPLPAKKLTKNEALSELIPELKKQHERGHTAASLAAALDANNLHVSERKMAQLLRH